MCGINNVGARGVGLVFPFLFSCLCTYTWGVVSSVSTVCGRIEPVSIVLSLATMMSMHLLGLVMLTPCPFWRLVSVVWELALEHGWTPVDTWFCIRLFFVNVVFPFGSLVRWSGT